VDSPLKSQDPPGSPGPWAFLGTEVPGPGPSLLHTDPSDPGTGARLPCLPLAPHPTPLPRTTAGPVVHFA